MKRLSVLVATVLTLVAAPSGLMPAAGADVTSEPYEMVQIEAQVSGLSQLILQGNTAQWHHLNGVAPGRLDGNADATVINGVAWYPEWPDEPSPENRNCDCYSDTFTGVSPALLDLAFTLDLRLVEGRGTVSVVQNPAVSNDYTSILQFDDRDQVNGDRYIVEFDLRAEVPPPPQTLRIKAHVDGLSRLILQGDTARWHHFSYAAPGRHFFVDEPTIFSGVEWYPTWPDVPDAENRDCECYSSVFDDVRPALPPTAFTVDLRLIRSREATTVVQQPTASNDFTTVIEFDDVNSLGPAWYIVEFDVPQLVAPLQLMKREIRKLQNQGVLNRGQANALLAKLEGVQAKKHDHRMAAACGQLGAFDHQVAGFARSGILRTADARRLGDWSAQVSSVVCLH